MKKFLRKLETIYAAAAFAESGEFEAAREMLKEEKRMKKRDIAESRPRKRLRAQ